MARTKQQDERIEELKKMGIAELQNLGPEDRRLLKAYTKEIISKSAAKPIERSVDPRKFRRL